MLENRAFDNFFGYRPGVNGINGTEYNSLNTTNASAKKIFHTPTCPYINECDPNHGLPATSYKIFGPVAAAAKNFTNPTMSGFVEFEDAVDKQGHKDFCNVMTGFTPERLPVINALADEFLLFDRFFASLPGPTWPNRLFFMAGTSSGLTETFPWYHDVVGQLFPTRTIFDQVEEAGGTWKVYFNDTPWELFVGTLANHPEHLQPVDQLWVDAREGTLPDFAFINPRSGINMTLGVGSNDQHPDHDVAVGESYLKDIYEALRASPQWNETLLVLTYDEHGGFFDHVPTPLNVPPPGDNESSYPDKGFLFDRLGVRIPTLLVSPWIKKGVVASAPEPSQKPFANSEFELTSIIASTRKLLPVLNATPALTKRDAWAATFESFLGVLDEPRTDCPMHLPAPPPFARMSFEEAGQPVNSLQQDIMAMHAHLAGVPFPSHIVIQGHVSEWLQAHYHIHRERTMASRTAPLAAAPRANSDARSYMLVVQPQGTRSVCQNWTVRGDADTFVVVACRVSSAVEMCLDSTSGALLSVNVSVSPCSTTALSGSVLERHRWILRRDATLRPFGNSSLCFTTSGCCGASVPHLDSCESLRVDQHLAYDGRGPGEADTGELYTMGRNLAVVQEP
jgi:phospholipase C